MVDISVIVPIYKVEKYLEKCLDGILSQTFNNFEVILVDDGSPDRCGQICDEYASKDKRIKVIHQKNQGVGAARNNGLKKATGKYIYFCDPDDYMEPTLLEDNYLLAEKYQANLVLFGYYHEIHISKDQKIVIPNTNDSVFLESKTDFRDAFEKLFNSGVMYTLWNKMYKSEYLKQYGLQFEHKKVGEDTAFNYKIYENLDRVYVNEKLYYHYLERADSALRVYRDNKFEMRYKETEMLEQLVKSWGYEEKYKKLIMDDWLATLYMGIDNLFVKDCPLNNKEKYNKIMEYINTPPVKNALMNMPIYESVHDDSLSRRKLTLLKNRQIKQLMFILSTRQSLIGVYRKLSLYKVKRRIKQLTGRN